MIGEMDEDSVVGYFRNKSILITGSTGFLGKGYSEGDLSTAEKKTWCGVRKFYRRKDLSFGRRYHEDFGLDSAQLRALCKDIDIIVNGAATTNFSERYDAAFDVNVLGAKNVCAFANKCTKLKMLLHVSTAYVAGEQEGLIPEKPFLMEKAEKKTMKELGLKRARHFGWPNTYVFTKAMGEMIMGHLRGRFLVVIIRPSIITSTLKEPFPGWMEGIRTIDLVMIGYAKQILPFFIGDLDLIIDVIPGDIVVNAMMVAMAAQLKDQQPQIIYHVTSSLRNPAPSALVVESMHCYFFENPLCKGRNGEHVRMKKMRFFSTLAQLRFYTALVYKLPLQMLGLLNIALCGVFSRYYNKLSRKYIFFMHMVELYAPLRFDDTNLERLRMAMNTDQNNNGSYYLDFDPKSVDWDDYFYRVHIPGVVKYTCH
ncbi:hypothetical protein CFC21_033380 [Triticum aestivum]|uniref:Fatty acyl-CoA reductase n=2 Tax=Triticum aestivum TaxID=4565 RepID=A0A9R1F0R7_WHEAT|nr:hypothetical protein CFC21_033380 [Triticum aestivum]